MLARHPITGKDIRIVSLETSISRDQKTLAWLDEPPAELERWSRWDIGATSSAAAERLHTAGLPPDIVICLNPHEETAAWCKSGQAKAARIVAVTKAFVEFMTIEKLATLRLGNLICLDEIHDMYPFVGTKWDGTENDAKILLALVLQMGRTFPAEPSTRNTRSLRLESAIQRPQPLWLVGQYYKPDQAKRGREIEACFQKNLECPVIDKIVLLNERAYGLKHPKVEERVIAKRLTYADVIRWIYEHAPPDTLIAFANADIFLDADTWRNLWSTDLETMPKFLAILRWNVDSVGATDKATLFGPRADSQDTWVVSSNAVKAVTWDWAALDFPFGKGGCDNAITMEMFKKRFLIVNPALSLKTYHLHASEVRTYDSRNIVDKPAYLYIHPTGLHDKKPVVSIDNVAAPHPFKFASFARPVRGPLTPAQARTFCTMVSRATQGMVELDADDDNIWSPPPVSLYRVNDVIQTRDGLAYTYDSILVGKTKASVKAWSDSKISYLSAAIPVEDAMIAPLPDSVAKSPARFLLEYLSKIFLMREEFGAKTGDFWCGKNEACIETIKMFSWPKQEIPVLSRDDNQQAWCSEAALWPYQDTPEGFISREEVGALRSALGLGGWKGVVGERQLVIVVDSKWITDEVADALEEQLSGFLSVKIVWAGRSSLDTCVRALRGAWGAVMFEQTLAPWCWVLPKGGYVWEIQNEMEPSASLLHTACAAELEHRMTIVPKGSPNDVEKKSLIAKLVKAIRAELEPKTVAEPVALTQRPKIFLPHGHTGFFAHSGDSFREIVTLWAERGFVDCIKSSSAHHVWLGSIGEILLYDRPTHEWLNSSPPAERAWKLALFGNPPPPTGDAPTSAWSFWPRRPALVEAIVARGTPSKPWESRAQTLVFYGRSENQVQKKRRSGFDWAPQCSEFVHVDGLKPYPFTQEQYLEKLTDARFGLCLAGYGYKCHREIECMAMGCIPIVAADVDMANYAEPPEEGLHYFRVEAPEDIPSIIEKTTAERWTVMSVACRDWWRRNASVDGMWELTRRLAGV